MSDAPLPLVAFGSSREAASDLNMAAKTAKDGPFYVFPFNQYEPAESIWWLSPRDEGALNPSFKVGKVAVLSKRLTDPGTLFIGLEVEKGIEEPAAEMFTSGHGQRMVMGPEWTWHKFIADLED